MRDPRKRPTLLAALFSFCLLAFAARAQNASSQIGGEVAIPRHLQDGDEFQLSIPQPLDQNQPAGSAAFFQGNTKFITRKLWGTANSGTFFHHGKFTTMREAVLAHSGEALTSRQAFEALSPHERDCVIEFLKTLQVLPSGTVSSDDPGRPKRSD